MAANMFVEISDIRGDSTEASHRSWIVIESMTWGLERAVDMTDIGSTQRGHANANFEKVEVTSLMGLASNKLMVSAANGTIRQEITIHLTRSGESASTGLEAYSIWKLKDVMINSYAVESDPEGVPKETWSMAYGAIEHEYKSTDQKTAKLTTENTFKWNVQTGMVE